MGTLLQVVHYSLQYLSLSDATVISFLSPSVTVLLGYLLLKEPFSLSEGIAGRESSPFSPLQDSTLTIFYLVISLTGVFLVARPEFVFGSVSPTLALDGTTFARTPERSTSSERLVAVGYVHPSTTRTLTYPHN